MKSIKIISIIGILVIILLNIIPTICLAETVNPITPGNYKPEELNGYESAFEKASAIIKGIQIVGTIVAAVGIMILGIKYMMGSVEERADYKKTMIPYLIGCIMIFAIITIVSIIFELANSLNVE